MKLERVLMWPGKLLCLQSERKNEGMDGIGFFLGLLTFLSTQTLSDLIILCLVFRLCKRSELWLAHATYKAVVLIRDVHFVFFLTDAH